MLVVSSFLATKVFLGNFPATERGWIIIKLANDERRSTTNKQCHVTTVCVCVCVCVVDFKTLPLFRLVAPSVQTWPFNGSYTTGQGVSMCAYIHVYICQFARMLNNYVS